jgi:hypothetical protein
MPTTVCHAARAVNETKNETAETNATQANTNETSEIETRYSGSGSVG